MHPREPCSRSLLHTLLCNEVRTETLETEIKEWNKNCEASLISNNLRIYFIPKFRINIKYLKKTYILHSIISEDKVYGY